MNFFYFFYFLCFWELWEEAEVLVWWRWPEVWGSVWGDGGGADVSEMLV